jgi:hypothetical protein
VSALLAAVACRLGFHVPLAGVDLRWAFWAPCRRRGCEALIEGRLVGAARRGR